VLLGCSGWLTLALSSLSFLYYCFVIGGMLLAWRFHSSRTLFALVVLLLAQNAIAFLGGRHASPGTQGWLVLQAVAVLVPLNFVLIAPMKERGFTVSATAPFGLMLFVQLVIVTVLYRAVEDLPASAAHAHHSSGAVSSPSYALTVLAAAGGFLLVRFLFTGKPGDSALFWSLSAFGLSLHFVESSWLSMLYTATAACILASSIIENSYLLAYHDELTTLPSRRAFNDALLRLHPPYSIAVVDIDHFKRFNDTYGHDTGDQVLRLVATRLAGVTGGGQAYRCGGEEFNILFTGKTTEEVVDHLEQLRAKIESSAFSMRSGDRRQASRGSDRRGPRTRGRGRKGDAIRHLAKKSVPAPLSVTVSIGLATSSKPGSARPESDAGYVLEEADKALYRAKANGRNRVETATSERRRSRVKTAGIA
jgi:diguanylate cyclase (GGDEF)-like protein